jgi:hypothetical protein
MLGEIKQEAKEIVHCRSNDNSSSGKIINKNKRAK